MRGDVELTKILVQIPLPKALILVSSSPRVGYLSRCPLLPVTPGCLLGLWHPLLAITVLSGFVSTLQLAFEASLLARSHFPTLC